MDEPVDEEPDSKRGPGCCITALVGGFGIGLVVAVGEEMLLLEGAGSWDHGPTLPWLLFVLLLPCLFVSALGTLIKPFRRGAIVPALLSFGTLAGLWHGAPYAGRIKHTAFEEAIVRMEPIVRAAHRYEDEKGHPPTSLRVLMPEYLERMPGRIPAIKLVQGPTVEGSAWSLEAPVARSFLDGDILLYLPSQNYEALDCTYHYMLGDWAFLGRPD
ncbi:MAG: hypothetical protein ACI8QC_004035 [Planctomycetota bacterium]|jgi:hypothetical protein